MTTTATMTKAKAKKDLTTQRRDTIPADYREGLSLREFVRAVLGTEGHARFVLPAYGGDASFFVRLHDVAGWQAGVFSPDADLDVMASPRPALLDLRVFAQPGMSDATVRTIGASIPLTLVDRLEQAGVRGGSPIMVDSALKSPAPDDQVRAAIGQLVDRGAHLILHAGDRIEGFWRLARPVGEQEGRRLTAALSRLIPGATKVRYDAQREGQHPLALALIHEPGPILYATPAPRPACNIVPRHEPRAWGDVSATVEPEVLIA